MTICIMLGAGKFAHEIAASAQEFPNPPLICTWRSAAAEFHSVSADEEGFTLGGVSRLTNFLKENGVSAIAFAGNISPRRDLMPVDPMILENLKDFQRGFSASYYVPFFMSLLFAAGIEPVPITNIFEKHRIRETKHADQENFDFLSSIRNQAFEKSVITPVESVVAIGKKLFFEEPDGTDALIQSIDGSRDNDFRRALIKFGHIKLYPLITPVIGPQTLALCLEFGIENIIVDDRIAIAEPDKFWSSPAWNSVSIEKVLY